MGLDIRKPTGLLAGVAAGSGSAINIECARAFPAFSAGMLCLSR